MKEKIYIIGDTHGVWASLFPKLDNFNIRDCILISVGDLGIGFGYSPASEVDRYKTIINEEFARRNIKFYGIRGNHDDPAWFDSKNPFQLSHFKLLPDYTYLEFNDETFLFVGGAISVDRSGKHRREGLTYWTNEKFVLKPEKVTKKADVLITHSGPTWVGPIAKNGLVKGFCEDDPHLWAELVEERQLHEELFKLAKPHRWFCGHFHEYCDNTEHGCKTTILNIDQICEYVKGV